MPCIRPEDITPHPGAPSLSSGLQDENILDQAGKEKSAAAFVGTHRLKVIRQTYQPGGRHFPHQHEHTEQAYYLLEGEGRMRLGDEEFDVEAGMMVYIPPKTEHEIVNIGNGPLVNLLICVELDEDEA